MPQVQSAAFGSSSYISALIATATVTPSAVGLAFQPAVHRVRKARLSFTAGGADTFTIDIEFHDDVFEEHTMTGHKKAKGL